MEDNRWNTRILKDAMCRDCGWAVIDINCNLSEESYSKSDWWFYCSNPTCQNHKGEDVFQETPEWVLMLNR